MLVLVLQPLQKCKSGLAKIAQWSRALATFTKDQSSVSSSQIEWLTTDYSVSSRRLRTTYGLPGQLHSCAHAPHRDWYTHFKKNDKYLANSHIYTCLHKSLKVLSMQLDFFKCLRATTFLKCKRGYIACCIASS